MQNFTTEDTHQVQSEKVQYFQSKRRHQFAFVKSGLFKNSVKLLITALFFVLVNRSLKRSDFQAIISNIDIPLLFLSLSLGVFSFYFQILRWQGVLKSQDLPCGIKIATKTMTIGFFLGFLTPGRIGELFRGVGLSSGRKAVSIIAVALERVFAVFMTMVFGVLSIIAQFIFYNISASTFFFCALIFSVILFLLAARIINYLNLKINNVASLRSVLNYLRQILSGLHALPVGRLIIYSLLSHLFLIVQTSLILEMFGSHGFLKNCIVASQAYAFMLFLPFFVANIGLREFSFSLFLDQLVSVSTIEPPIALIAFGVSHLILMMNIILPAIIGFLWMLLGPKDRKNCYKDESNFYDKVIYDK